MTIEEVHEAALLLHRLAHVYHFLDSAAQLDDETRDSIALQMTRVWESLPYQPGAPTIYGETND